MDKIDFKKTMKGLYAAPKGQFAEVDVPKMRYLMADGEGDPNSAPAYRATVSGLFSLSYAMKFAVRRACEIDYVVPPLEGLWWAERPADFVARRKNAWKWTMMIMVPDFVDTELFEAAAAKARAKLGALPKTLRLEHLVEGRCLQTLHIGSYDDEEPILAQLHDQLMPTAGLTFNGKHHEIYLGDPRKSAPDKLKTILRQPVRPT